ncbi:putative nuclear mrna splicing via spliceosome [Fasciola hepatica]|uniref:Nuclear mrna splicing via spliceosome n=1 Tax=Fasciola hepatica TaxID=6192 RepID=A0A4E0R2V2_FASHE|nr:putative nuclear mrna splicing via spliceosome [Fasciola hepatica]
MGRRSVNTTKSGKFMNPTDQARKEARKRELKKNKKQRMAVRHAVLKSKDPLQLLEETALYDKQEYDPSVQAQLNERVIQEKRKRLLETFDRLVILYRKEDAEYANRLQAARQDYDKKRHEMMLYYGIILVLFFTSDWVLEQVKLAERVKASEIPLPKLPQSQMGLLTSDIPLPAGSYTKGILKKSLGLPGLPPGIVPAGRKPPAPPPGPPPELSDSEGEQETVDVIRPRKIRFADADPPGIESESAHINVQAAPSVDNPSMLPPSGFSVIAPPPSQIPLPPPNALPSFAGLIRPGFPGAPQPTQPRFMFQRPGVSAVLSAPPSLHPRDPLDNVELLGAVNTVSLNAASAMPNTGQPINTIIEAKPQLKNLIGDATRFVPTALKVRRAVRDPSGKVVTVGGGSGASGSTGIGRSTGAAYDRIPRADGSLGSVSTGATSLSATSKDDAYEEFMREMEGLL